MMKSEWDPLKSAKPDIKQRLNNLFGRFDQYSDFAVEPHPSSHQGQTDSTLLKDGTGSWTKDEQHDGSQGSGDNNARNNNLDDMFMLINVVKPPLSPVQSAALSPTEKRTQKTPTENAIEPHQLNVQPEYSRSLGTELEALLQQITCVAPLISPIKSEILADDDTLRNRKRPNLGSAQYEDATKRVLVHTDEGQGSSVRNMSNCSKHFCEKDQRSATGYRIKISSQNFLRLLESKEDHKKADVAVGTPEKVNLNCKDESVNSSKALSESSLSEKQSKSFVQTMPGSCVKVEGGTLSMDHFQNRARELKKRGNDERERVKQIFFHFESIAFYIMASSVSASKPEKMYLMLMEAVNFLNSSWASFKNSKTVASSIPASYIRVRLKRIQLMVSSCLAYHLYSIRSTQTLSTCSILQRYEKENPQNIKRPTSRGTTEGTSNNHLGTTTSSPAASTPSSNRSINSQQPMVSLPAEIYSSMSRQIRNLHHLMWSHKLWKDAKTSSSDSDSLVSGLNTLCGELRQDSELVEVAEFLLTAISWLRKHYEWMQSKHGEKKDGDTR